MLEMTCKKPRAAFKQTEKINIFQNTASGDDFLWRYLSLKLINRMWRENQSSKRIQGVAEKYVRFECVN